MSEEPPIITTAEDVHAHPRKSGHRVLDLAIALTAIFISVVSLAIAVEHGIAQRRLVAANSWPFLTANVRYSNDTGQTSLVVENDGVGPAKVEYVQLYYKGEALHAWSDLFKRIGRDRRQAATESERVDVSMAPAKQTIIRAGDHVTLFEISRPIQSPYLRQALPKALLALTFKSCYCSIFDECWLSDLDTLKQVEVDHCPVDDHPFRTELKLD